MGRHGAGGAIVLLRADHGSLKELSPGGADLLPAKSDTRRRGAEESAPPGSQFLAARAGRRGVRQRCFSVWCLSCPWGRALRRRSSSAGSAESRGSRGGPVPEQAQADSKAAVDGDAPDGRAARPRRRIALSKPDEMANVLPGERFVTCPHPGDRSVRDRAAISIRPADYKRCLFAFHSALAPFRCSLGHPSVSYRAGPAPAILRKVEREMEAGRISVGARPRQESDKGQEALVEWILDW